MKKKCIKCESVAEYITDGKPYCEKHSFELIRKDSKKTILGKYINKTIKREKTASHNDF